MIDIFIIVLVAWAAFNGWRNGLLKEFVSSVGLLVGLLVAATCYSSFGEYLAVEGSETNMFTSLVAFLLLWIVVPIVLGLVANLLTKAIKGMKLGIPNSLLGALVGGFKYVLLISCVLNVMDGLHIMNEEKRADSKLYGPVAGAVGLLFSDDATEDTPDDEAQADTLWVDMRAKH